MIYTSPHSNISNIIGTSAEDIDTRKQGSDRYLLMSVVILMTFGLLAVYSSIAFFAETKSTTAGSHGEIRYCLLRDAHLLKNKLSYHRQIQPYWDGNKPVSIICGTCLWNGTVWCKTLAECSRIFLSTFHGCDGFSYHTCMCVAERKTRIH
jgi:hypothetical protein